MKLFMLSQPTDNQLFDLLSLCLEISFVQGMSCAKAVSYSTSPIHILSAKQCSIWYYFCVFYMHNLCLEVLIVQGMRCASFKAKTFPLI